jgi:ferrous iron transport protein B
MSRCGLSGKSFIPMLSSVACAVPGIMATRVIENRRDRLVTILVAPLMSCSARLPVYILLIAAFFPVRDDEHPDRFGWYVPGLVMFSMYMIGLVVAPLVAWALKTTLLRGETPVFVMEMPLYKRPSLKTVVRRMTESAWAFLYRAGTLILASMVLVWALLYFPSGDFPERRAAIDEAVEKNTMTKEDGETKGKSLDAEWKEHSYLGQLGHAIEPAVRPLGWDWKIGVAALASFPAREVVVGTLGVLYQTGDVDTDEIRDSKDLDSHRLTTALRGSTLKPASALSLMVFFALCCQCASTLAVIKRETKSWRWPAFTFVYMTFLAYVGALLVYQVARWIPTLMS